MNYLLSEGSKSHAERAQLDEVQTLMTVTSTVSHTLHSLVCKMQLNISRIPTLAYTVLLHRHRRLSTVLLVDRTPSKLRFFVLYIAGS